jgi:glycosyltransferase involved in cell wall biosynthesis
MASGLACVGIDYGAPGALLRAGRGILVPLGNREELITRYVRELETLLNAPERVQRFGNEARKFAMKELTWSAKARKMMDVYRWVTGGDCEVP